MTTPRRRRAPIALIPRIYHEGPAAPGLLISFIPVAIVGWGIYTDFVNALTVSITPEIAGVTTIAAFLISTASYTVGRVASLTAVAANDPSFQYGDRSSQSAANAPDNPEDSPIASTNDLQPKRTGRPRPRGRSAGLRRSTANRDEAPSPAQSSKEINYNVVDILTQAAHELRAPVTSIRLAARIIRNITVPSRSSPTVSPTRWSSTAIALPSWSRNSWSSPATSPAWSNSRRESWMRATSPTRRSSMSRRNARTERYSSRPTWPTMLQSFTPIASKYRERWASCSITQSSTQPIARA